ncbi:hypothetical protein LTR10_017035 [Elasticomyces elasticus]|uniref:SMP domain-containing protein n=1 Tax=Exophiala sideris TaxID=1016849 RepID=A0ABR0J0J0_9EURO|nr:hypothetical protein LTR10_017035 [Elasticomyces elasticus]KAK5023044.1 hypothetical protein LTS07_009537 [Exophiala sideris]KAK5026769.1 hypothetical protein LTR13_009809 [Exophiala sideris]KAK5052422.1 hypothetical protein LTR69_009760 [Exophiala sideris]KAK5178207.1 hypothetical protein LTR44_009291 [Eurotiomycetes sp. CCFEE 6388]
MPEGMSPTKTETKSHEAPAQVNKTEAVAIIQNPIKATDPSPSSGEGVSISSPPAHAINKQDGNVTSPVDGVDGTAPVKVKNPPKFSEEVEKEIRTMMNNARSVQDHNMFKRDEDVAKDVIVRAVAYMQGEDHLSPYRALNQAHRDHRAARRNTNSGKGPRGLVDRGSKPRTISDAAKLALDDVKNESAIVDGHNSSDVDTTKAIASPSNASSNAESTGNGNGSDKENATAKSSGPHASKPKKKGYWKARREARKKHGDGNGHKNGQNQPSGADNGMAEAKDHTGGETGKDKAIEQTPGATHQEIHGGGVAVQA